MINQPLGDLAELQQFLDDAAVCIHSVNADGIILWANQNELDLLGYQRDEYIGHALGEFLPDDALIEEFKEKISSFDAKSRYDIELAITAHDGTLRQFACSVIPYYQNQGELLYTRTISHDITRLKLEQDRRLMIERALREALNATRVANEAKTTFLGNISHELRTPMNSITGFSRQLQKLALGSSLNERDCVAIGAIHRNSQHLLRLINDMLDLSELDAGNLCIKVEPLNLVKILIPMIERFRSKAQQKKLTFNFEYDQDNVPIIADKERIRQIVENLLSNAIKYTHKGDIRLSINNLNDQDLGPAVAITVSDTGVGISKENQRLLFRKFVQINDGLSRPANGAGIGLVLIAEFARLHGGKIAVSSKPNQGSKFTVTLPLTPLH